MDRYFKRRISKKKRPAPADDRSVKALRTAQSASPNGNYERHEMPLERHIRVNVLPKQLRISEATLFNAKQLDEYKSGGSLVVPNGAKLQGCGFRQSSSHPLVRKIADRIVPSNAHSPLLIKAELSDNPREFAEEIIRKVSLAWESEHSPVLDSAQISPAFSVICEDGTQLVGYLLNVGDNEADNFRAALPTDPNYRGVLEIDGKFFKIEAIDLENHFFKMVVLQRAGGIPRLVPASTAIHGYSPREEVHNPLPAHSQLIAFSNQAIREFVMEEIKCAKEKAAKIQREADINAAAEVLAQASVTAVALEKAKSQDLMNQIAALKRQVALGSTSVAQSTARPPKRD